jgi:hypothetical protein
LESGYTKVSNKSILGSVFAKRIEKKIKQKKKKLDKMCHLGMDTSDGIPFKYRYLTAKFFEVFK